MKAAVILDLEGHFGPIDASGIWNRVKAYGLDRLYFDVRQITRQIIDHCQSKNTLAGINIDPAAWYGEDLAAGAIRVHAKLNELGYTGANARDLCPVLFDWEHHSIEQTVAGLKTWRKVRSVRDTCWSMEPLQGGWVGDRQLRQQIAKDTALRLLPQCYRFNMWPVAQDAVLYDLLRFYPRTQIELYYGAFYKDHTGDKHLPCPEAWAGCLYDLSHLPLP